MAKFVMTDKMKEEAFVKMKIYWIEATGNQRTFDEKDSNREPSFTAHGLPGKNREGQIRHLRKYAQKLISQGRTEKCYIYENYNGGPLIEKILK